jgi:hypothetical protein
MVALCQGNEAAVVPTLPSSCLACAVLFCVVGCLPRYVTALLTEVSTLFMLDHPHIVKLFGFCCSCSGEPALVMELIPSREGGGVDLRHWVRTRVYCSNMVCCRAMCCRGTRCCTVCCHATSLRRVSGLVSPQCRKQCAIPFVSCRCEATWRTTVLSVFDSASLSRVAWHLAWRSFTPMDSFTVT